MMCSPRKKRAARGAGAAWLVGVLLISVQGGAEAVTNALVIAPSAEQSADGALSHAVFPELGSALADGRRRLSYSQLERLTASDGADDDSFGYSVAIDGDTIVAGAVQSNNSGSPVMPRRGSARASCRSHDERARRREPVVAAARPKKSRALCGSYETDLGSVLLFGAGAASKAPTMRGFGENDGWWSSTRGAADSTTCVCAFVSLTFVIARSALTTARPHFGSSTRRSAWSGPSARVVGVLLASTANLAAAQPVEPANASVMTRRKLGYAMTDSNIRTAVTAWLSDASAAKATYGHISTWETGGVTVAQPSVKETTNQQASMSSPNWDSQGMELYKKQYNLLAESDYYTVSTLKTGPVAYNKKSFFNHGKWVQWAKKIDGNPTWEPETFKMFDKYIPGHTNYVDFGTWIGPTLFYATQLVKKAVGIEADPVAFASVENNLKGNIQQPWHSHTKLYPVGVGLGSGLEMMTGKMTSKSSGNSCSGLIPTPNCGGRGPNQISWVSKLYSLKYILDDAGVPATHDTFVKIDVEGFECKLLPSLLDWLTSLSTLPTLFVAFHPLQHRCSSEEYQSIIKVAKLYTDVIVLSNTAMSYEEWIKRSGKNGEVLFTAPKTSGSGSTTKSTPIKNGKADYVPTVGVSTLTKTDLTVVSWWRDNFSYFLRAHIRFYRNFWRAKRLFIIICVTEKTNMQSIVSTLIELCGALSQNKNMDGVSVYSCRDGGEVLTLEYTAKQSTLPSDYAVSRIKTGYIYDKKYRIGSSKHMPIDHDEFYIPAHKNVDAVVKGTGFNYHIIDIKPVVGSRDFNAPFKWVDQPYFYKFRCKWKGEKSYPWDDLDGKVSFTASVNGRINHNGPHKEHNSLRACAKRGADAYKQCLDNHNIMCHMSVHSESYFLTQKFFYHAKPGPATQTTDIIEKKKHFDDCFLNPEKEFTVFQDDFVHSFFDSVPQSNA